MCEIAFSLISEENYLRYTTILMITIQELLHTRGLPHEARVKMVRHKDKRINLYDCYKYNLDFFMQYQSSQNRPVFKGVDYLVSFIGEDNNTARFIGVFRILEQIERNKTVDWEYYQINNPILQTRYWYPMKEMIGYEDIKDRVIIKWRNPISWCQWFSNTMEVVELSHGLRYRRFTDYLDFVITFDELTEIVINRCEDWQRALSSINGVYLIRDNNTGLLYVGSTYGSEGVWGRWSEYVLSGGHGGNKSLLELLNGDPLYASKHFIFSLLMLLPKSITPEEAIRKEQLFKRKLGTLSRGLNNN